MIHASNTSQCVNRSLYFYYNTNAIPWFLPRSKLDPILKPIDWYKIIHCFWDMLYTLINTNSCSQLTTYLTINSLYRILQASEFFKKHLEKINLLFSEASFTHFLKAWDFKADFRMISQFTIIPILSRFQPLFEWWWKQNTRKRKSISKAETIWNKDGKTINFSIPSNQYDISYAPLLNWK